MNKNIVGTSPLVSVLVPMYNTEKTIERCIKSILSQTYTNLEIVLLNDGSIDKTYEIAKSFALPYLANETTYFPLVEVSKELNSAE